MFQMKLMNDGAENDPVDSRIMATQYEPREGLIYRFRERPNDGRATRYKVTRVEVDQVWGDTANAIAWVYVVKLDR